MKNKVILLVEDNQRDEELVLRALRKHNIQNEVFVTRDGAEAPTVVLLDIKLPKIDGLEVLRRIRGDERTKLLPVVILTSSKEDKDRFEGYASGANSFGPKPIEFREFSNAIGQLGLYWLLLNEAPPSARR